jgi:hypothetical protein
MGTLIRRMSENLNNIAVQMVMMDAQDIPAMGALLNGLSAH